jgi:hypothetical protein
LNPNEANQKFIRQIFSHGIEPEHGRQNILKSKIKLEKANFMAAV